MNRYDGLMRMRLNVTDDSRVEIGAGWTVPEVQPGLPGQAWTFTGKTESLWMDDNRAAEVGTEVLFRLPPDFRTRHMLHRYVSTALPEGGNEAKHRLEVLGSHLEFSIYNGGDWLGIYAGSSDGLLQTLTENWLAEPLRIMFGQLMFPRMVARANPDRTIVSIRRSPRWHPELNWTGMWRDPATSQDKDGFWRTYAGLLSHVARARDVEGRPNYEANRVTKLYEEVIQASRGSRWVCALTFASSIEGLVRALVPRGTRHPAVNDKGIAC